MGEGGAAKAEAAWLRSVRKYEGFKNVLGIKNRI